MRHQTADLMKRLVITLVGQGLSNLAVISVMAKHVKKGCFYVVLSAILVSVFLAANAYALYEYLVWRGLSNLEAFLMVDGLVLLLIIVAKLSVCRHFSHIFLQKGCAGKSPPVANLIAEILGAFVDGMHTGKRDYCHKHHRECCECIETMENDRGNL